MLRDVEYLRSRFSKLDGAADLGDYLVNLIENKSLPQSSESSNVASDMTDTSSEPSLGTTATGQNG